MLSSELIASVKRRALLPTADETYAESDYLAMADEEIIDYCVPLLLELNEEWMVRRYDVDLDGRQANGEPYALPDMCSAESLKAALWGDGNENNFRPLPRLEPERKQATSGFYLQDDLLFLTPTDINIPALRLLYFHQPGTLRLEDTVAQITALPGGTGLTVTEGSDVSGLTTGQLVDVVSAKRFRVRMQAVTLTRNSSTSYVLGETVESAVQVGDYVCPTGTSCVPQLPKEMHPLLAQRIAMKLLEGKNDTGYQNAVAGLADAEKRCRSALSQRTVANPRPVQNFYAPGWRNRSVRRSTSR